MAKKIEEGISIFFSHQRTADNTLTMTYEYDDHGIKCLNYDGDYRPVEPHCLECGDKPDDCECDKFVPATYWDESAERWIDGRERIPWDLLDFGTFDANQCGICRVRGSWSWAWAGEGRLNEDTICSDCDKVFIWDEDNDEYKRRPCPRPRLRCRPPVGPPKENEPKYNTWTFLWSTVEELLEEHKPTTQQRFRRWKRGDHIELEYRLTKGRNPSWYYWAIRPCDNFTWVVIAYRNGSVMEIEWCEQLPEEQDEE